MPKLIKKKKIVVKKKAIKKKAIKKKVAGKPVVKKVKPVKKIIKKKVPAKKTKKTVKSEKGFLGEITHYFSHVKAGVIKLKAPLAVGDRIKIKGHTTDFIQTVNSIQIDREPIPAAKPGDEIGFMVESRVRRGDKVTKL